MRDIGASHARTSAGVLACIAYYCCVVLESKGRQFDIESVKKLTSFRREAHAVAQREAPFASSPRNGDDDWLFWVSSEIRPYQKSGARRRLHAFAKKRRGDRLDGGDRLR